jgi:prepilin-type N-terminal cleavage/methylation domain-containing protein
MSELHRLRSRSRGFTLIELLVVIAIVVLLIAILMPALGKAREQGKAAHCLANLRQILTATHMYRENDEQRVIPWYRFPAYGGADLYTPWVFGGFRAPNPDTTDGYVADSELIPTELRPLNRYIDPSVQGYGQIDVYKCLSDRTQQTAIIGQTDPNVAEEESRNAWRTHGSSYTLNTRFMQGYSYVDSGTYTFNFDVGGVVHDAYSRRITPHMIGGKASRFIMWDEQGFHAQTYQAGPTLATSLAFPQKRGWHREFSKWSFGMVDGSAVYGYYDTRLNTSGSYTIWQPP